MKRIYAGVGVGVCVYIYIWSSLVLLQDISLIDKWCSSLRIICFTITNELAYEVNLFLNRNLICMCYGYQCAIPLINYLNKGSGIDGVCITHIKRQRH